MFGYFTKPIATETVARATPGQLLLDIEVEFRLAESAFTSACQEVAAHNARHKDIRTAQFGGDACVLVNAWKRDAELQRLEAARGAAQRKRNDLLQRRAEIMKNLGLIK